MEAAPGSEAANTDMEETVVLERVLHRLVVTEDAKLVPVLDKLLPKLLRKLNDTPAVRGKVIDILSHISKRVRPNASITLPCAELLQVCRDVPPTSFAFNFSLTFLDIAVRRARPSEKGTVAEQIARGISRLQKYSSSQNILLNIMIAVLENLPLRSEVTASGTTTAELSQQDSAVVTDWFLDLCLYPGLLTRDGSKYHGLSPAGLARLTEKEKEWPAELLRRRKLAVLRALKSDLFTPSAAVLPAIAAACSTHHEVVKAAEDLLKSLSSSDRNGALRRDSDVASGIFKLILGNSDNEKPTNVKAGEGAPALPTLRYPVSSALAVRSLAWLETECPEGTAARVPEAVRVSFQALFSGEGSAEATPRARGAPHYDRANAARFRAAGARLAAFIAARCKSEVLPMVAPLLLQAMQRVLTIHATPGLGMETDTGGGREGEAPAVGSSLLMQIQHAAMLEACYETIATLAVRRPSIFSGDTSVPRLLFMELSAKEPSLRVKISAALGALKNAYRGPNGVNIAPKIWSLLWAASSSPEYRARLCAVEWACDLFNFANVAARRLCVSLCGDSVTAVRNAATRGLQPSGGGSSPSSKYPTFGSFVLGALRDGALPATGNAGEVAKSGASVHDLPPVALARALNFSLECRTSPTHGRVDGVGSLEDDRGVDRVEDDEAVAVFLSLIEATLMNTPSATDGQHGHAQMIVLHRSAAVALKRLVAGDSDEADGPHADSKGSKTASCELTTSDVSPVSGVAARLASRGPWLQQWLTHEGSTDIREAFAETTGAAAEFMDPNSELVPLLRALGHKLKPCTMPGAVGFSNRAVSTAHGAACAIGATLARLAAAATAATKADAAAGDDTMRFGGESNASRAWAALFDDVLPSALSSVVAAIGHPVSLLHGAACATIGRVGAAGPLPLPSAGHGEITAAVAATSVASGTTFHRQGGADRVATIERVFEKLWTACKLGETTDASRRAEAAAEALGRCCRGARNGVVELEGPGVEGERVSARVRKTLRVLFDMAKNQKEEELQFAVAAAVADLAYSGPLHIPAGKVLQNMRTSSRAAQREMIERVLVEGRGGDEAMKGGGAMVDALDYVLYHVLYVLLEDHSPHVSGAAAVYLLAIVKRCKGHPLLAAYLCDVQAALTRKLTVRSEFVQEVAGKGLALVYEAATGESKQGLVDSLVEALSTGRRRAAGGVDVHGVTHAGAALSEAGAGAYGEMCAVANDVGRPDLIYSFLSMASHHAAWTTRRGASFGLGAIISQVSDGEAFREQLGRIVPRLFRYRFDPSAKTREAMEQLWRSIVGGASGGSGSSGDLSGREKEIVRNNLSAIISELLRAVGNRKWRDRQSACAALSDLLRGRSWDELGHHLELLWIMADRALDDIKESVAEVAVDYAKTLANVSVRLCDAYNYVPPHGTEGAEVENSTATAAAAAARSDAAGHGADALREEAGEARRTIGTMVEDFQTAEAEARARGEEGVSPAGGLVTFEGRDAAAEEVLRQAREREGQQAVVDGAGRGNGFNAGVGQVLGGRRNGPTVEEVLRPGRAGAGRTGPPPSGPAREAAAGAVAIMMPWLLRKGILSRCKASQGLAMHTLQRLVKVCDREALMPHLAELVATLIEGLSALEPQALQYMQFHAETQLEMTQDQMERLRLSVSRAGPLQDALDQCYRHLDDAKVVEDLMPRLLGLLRVGTGLATRSASAYVVLSLCERAPMEVRRAAPRLLPTLTNTALSERSSTLRRTYSSALSSVSRLAPAAGVSRLVARLVEMFREADPDYDKQQRRTLALLVGDLCRRAGGQLGASARGGRGGTDGEKEKVAVESGFAASGWARILPVAFVVRRDPDKPVADAFEEAWQEGLTQLQLGAAGSGEEFRVRNAKDAVLLMLPAVLKELSVAISSVSRVTKRQGCSGLKDLASTLGPALGQAGAGRRLVRRVLFHISDRTWEGKEELLEAVVALCTAGKGYAVMPTPLVGAETGAATGGSRYSRVVKRFKIESLIGEGEAKEDDDAANGGYESVVKQESSFIVKEDASAEGLEPRAGAGARELSVEGGADAGDDDNAENNDDTKADGAESAFCYEDKVGDLDNDDCAGEGEGDSRSPTVVWAAQPQQQGLSAAGEEPREDELMPKTGVESLDVEDDSPVTFGDVVTIMLSQLQRKSIPYRRSAAVSLAAILNAFPECCAYELVAPDLLDLACLEGSRLDDKEDPIMQARAISCLASAWPRTPDSVVSAEMEVDVAHRESVVNIQRTYAASLVRALSRAVRRKVWSVRVPIFRALAAVVSRTFCPVTPAPGDNQCTDRVPSLAMSTSVLIGSLLADVVHAVELGAEDAKYSQVRAAAVSVVVALTARKEIRLALTPHKEGLVKAARRAAEDAEPRVAVEGSKAVQNISWWP